MVCDLWLFPFFFNIVDCLLVWYLLNEFVKLLPLIWPFHISHAISCCFVFANTSNFSFSCYLFLLWLSSFCSIFFLILRCFSFLIVVVFIVFVFLYLADCRIKYEVLILVQRSGTEPAFCTVRSSEWNLHQLVNPSYLRCWTSYGREIGICTECCFFIWTSLGPWIQKWLSRDSQMKKTHCNSHSVCSIKDWQPMIQVMEWRQKTFFLIFDVLCTETWRSASA